MELLHQASTKGRDMETQVAVQGNGNLPANVDTDWGFDNSVSDSDVVIPKLLLMQKTSQLVDDENSGVSVGDIVRSTSKEILAKKGGPLEFVPIHQFKTWVKYDMSSGSPKFAGIEPCSSANEDLEWEYEEDGKQMRRDMTLNFYVLLKEDLVAHVEAKEKGTTTNLFPCLVSFSRTSYRAGKILATHFFMCGRNRIPVPGTVYSLSSERKSNDSNSWYTLDVAKVGETDPLLMNECREWWKILHNSANSVKVDHSDLEEEVGVETVDTKNVDF